MQPFNSASTQIFENLNPSLYTLIIILVNLHNSYTECSLVTATKNQELNNYDRTLSDESINCESANYVRHSASASCDLNQFLEDYFELFYSRRCGCGDKSGREPVRTRFLLYDVNRAEGFNLRRDVYIRMAKLVKILNK